MLRPLSLEHALDPYATRGRRVPTAIELDFLAHLEADGYPAGTRKNYKSALNRIDEITGRPAELAGAAECTELFRSGLGANTRRLQLSVLRHLHEWLASHGYPFDETARNAELPRPKRGAPDPVPGAVMDRLRKVARLVDDLEWKAYFFILDGCGVRVHEPLALTVGDVASLLHRSRDRQLTLRFGHTKTGGWTFPLWDVIAAGRSSARDVPGLLQRYAMKARPRGPLYDHEEAPFFAARETGRGVEWVANRWQQHCALAGVHPAPQLRRLRHTFGCEALELTKDIRRVKAWMNHSSLTTTERYAAYVGLQGSGG